MGLLLSEPQVKGFMDYTTDTDHPHKCLWLLMDVLKEAQHQANQLHPDNYDVEFLAKLRYRP